MGIGSLHLDFSLSVGCEHVGADAVGPYEVSFGVVNLMLDEIIVVEWHYILNYNYL